ncbi:MAG TPA: NAD(P)H-dependent glycerol-3-phosphate dehydrogenase [Candidatus Lustribacter sp.]|nr:NAD(P)H-dependent glycerol-3-phosphate dehydrogenase [Candidatus Lustribacter sp.]
MHASVIGAGSWGTALGAVLAGKGYDVAIWDVDPVPLESIGARHENSRYLPGIPLPPSLVPVTDLPQALHETGLVVLAVPSHAMRSVATLVRDDLPTSVPICSVTKGIEVDSLMTMSEVLEDVLPLGIHPFLTYLSGPSFAVEVARGMGTAVTVAAHWNRVARMVQEAFHTPYFRPYTSPDVVGVEIGGCTKNVVAIATGLADGMGFGANARAALITRGLAEITRLGVSRGANPQTLSGLAGIGDLLLTCSSSKSRNYRVGYGLGQGKSLAQIQAELGQVAEGVLNAKSVHRLAELMRVEMPISEAVYRLIYEDLSPRGVLASLTERDLKGE